MAPSAHTSQPLLVRRQPLPVVLCECCPRQLCEASLLAVAVPQELNNRLAAEIARLRTLLTGDAGGEATGSPLTQGKDAYELEVLLGAPSPRFAAHKPQAGTKRWPSAYGQG